eukprot:2495005-Karenia_brevis.AAC.1
MGRAGHAAQAGRVACLFKRLPTAREHVRHIFPDAAEHQILNAVPLTGAETELQRLRGVGLELTVDGTLAQANEARIDFRMSFQPCRG